MRKSVIITLESFMAAFSAAKRPEQKQAALEAAMEALRRPSGEQEPLLNLTDGATVN
jgi:Xaa-Pro aminopeptidase